MAEIFVGNEDVSGSGIIDDNNIRVQKTYSSSKIESELDAKAEKASNSSGKVLIGDGNGNPIASTLTPENISLAGHNHDASNIVISTVNFGGVLDENVDTIQKLADWIDDTGLHQAEITAEIAQDAVGGILTDTATIDFSYNDSLAQITADVKDGSITSSKLSSAVNDEIDGKSDIGHLHDDRYYTETETNAFLSAKANDASVLHKTGDETFEGVKTSKNDFHVGQQVGYVPTGLRAVSQSIWAKNNANAGGVHFSTIIDADGASIGQRMMAIWGYPHKTANGSIGGYEEFMNFSFPTYDGNTTYSKKIETNVGTITFKNISLIEYGTEWNMDLFYGPRLTLGSSQVDFGYRYRDSAGAELLRIRTEAKDVCVGKNMKMAKDYQSDASGNGGYFSIASRYERSGIPHINQGHILQVGWDAINSNPESSTNDGGWGLMFGATGNPYALFIGDLTQIGRSGGNTNIRGQVQLDELRVTKCRDITGINLNDVLTGGEYNTDGTIALNSPINDYIFLKVMVYSGNSSYITQEATMLASGATPVRKWIRKREAGTWYGWREFTLV